MKATILIVSSILLVLIASAYANTSLRGANRGLKNPVTCTAYIVLTEFEGLENDQKSVSCEDASGKFLQIDASNDQINALVSGKGFESGKSTIDITGKQENAKGAIIYGKNENIIANNANQNANAFNHGGRMLAVVEGTRTVLVVRMIAINGQTSSTEEELSNSVFGNGVDNVTLSSQYSKCSGNKLNLAKAFDRNVTNVSGGATAIRNGVTTVSVAVNVTMGGDTAMRNAAASALSKSFAVSNPSMLANHVMYCLPPGTMSAVAYAVVNGYVSVYSDKWCTYLSAQMHEIGHNLNLGHSNEKGNYKDNTGMMGSATGQSDTPKMCFNGANYWQLGWLATQGSTGTAVYQVATGGAVKFEMEGVVADSWSNQYSKVVKINASNATDYFVMFNLAQSFNVETREYGNQVTVVRAGAEGTGYSDTELVAALKASNTTALVMDSKTVAVKVISIDLSYGINSRAIICISDNGNVDCR